jgi:hypothetical protein
MRRTHAAALAFLLLGLAVPAQVADWHRLPALTSTATKGLAYDYARQRMVLLESSGWGGVSRTWEWVADAWSLRRTATTPPPRQDFDQRPCAGARLQARAFPALAARALLRHDHNR